MVVVVLSLPEGVMVVVVSFRGAEGEGVVWIEIQPDSKVDANITAISFSSIDGFTPPFELATLPGAIEAIFSPSQHK